MEIINVPIGKIKPYKDNPRKISDEAVEKVANSIQEFGFQQPIVVDNNYVIIVGHTRLKASRKLGLKEVPVVVADNLSDEQVKAYRLADNKTGEFSKWDDSLLDKELDELFNDLEFDMSPFGFELDEEDIEVEEDDFDEGEIVECYVHEGDIYQLGDHRLMCGDSTDADCVARLMNGQKADLVLTDPPYGVDIVQHEQVGGGGAVMFGGKAGKYVNSSNYKPIKGDETTDTARLSYDVMKDISSNQIIFGGNYFTDFLKPSPCWLVWDKQNTGNFADVEMAWTSFEKGAKLYKWLWNGLCRKGSREVEGKTRVHPTQKPVGLLGDILKDFSEKNNLILDLFGGSGSTLIACEQLARKCYMMEYEPYYVQVIIERWQKLTGKEAVKIG